MGAGVIKLAKKEWPTPAALVAGDCWHVFVKKIGKGYAGGGLNVTVRTRKQGDEVYSEVLKAGDYGIRAYESM